MNEETVLTEPTNPEPVNEQDSVKPESDDTQQDQPPTATDATQEAVEEAPSVPETYDLKLPENAVLDPSVIEETAAFAKELGLSNEHAQKLLERENASVSKVLEGQKEMLAQQVTQWGEEVKTDKEFGGANYEATVRDARRVIDKFGSEELKEALTASGYGNYPPLVKFCAQIGRLMKEDTSLGKDTPIPNKVRKADQLYGPGTEVNSE